MAGDIKSTRLACACAFVSRCCCSEPPVQGPRVPCGDLNLWSIGTELQHQSDFIEASMLWWPFNQPCDHYCGTDTEQCYQVQLQITSRGCGPQSTWRKAALPLLCANTVMGVRRFILMDTPTHILPPSEARKVPMNPMDVSFGAETSRGTMTEENTMPSSSGPLLLSMQTAVPPRFGTNTTSG